MSLSSSSTPTIPNSWLFMLLSLFFQEYRKVEMKDMWSRLFNTLLKSSLVILVLVGNGLIIISMKSHWRVPEGRKTDVIGSRCEHAPILLHSWTPRYSTMFHQARVIQGTGKSPWWEPKDMDAVSGTWTSKCDLMLMIMTNNRSPVRCHTVHCPVLHLVFTSHQRWKSRELLKPDE